MIRAESRTSVTCDNDLHPFVGLLGGRLIAGAALFVFPGELPAAV